MAEGKKSFVVYCDLIETVSKLSDDEAGRLFKHLLNYTNDLDPIAPDRLTEITFEPIRQQLKRDLISYNNKKKVKSEDGFLGNLKRWYPDLYEKVIKKEMTQEESVTEIKRRKTSVSDEKYRYPTKNVAKIAVTVTDTVTVNANVTDTVKKENINTGNFKKPTAEEIKNYCLERKNTVCAETFFNFYESKNWMIGKNKMKNWQAAVRTWENNYRNSGEKKNELKTILTDQNYDGGFGK